MKKLGLALFLLPLFFTSTYGSVENDTLKIAVLTDLHYLSPKLAVEGDALSAYERVTARNVKDLNEVFDNVIANLLKEKIDILLVTGDITNHGEKKSHEDFIEKILTLHDSGTRIFVTPGNHDINIQNPKAYLGVEPSTTENITKEEFAELYRLFGYNEALKRDSASLSYLSVLNEKTWLLSIDTNRYDEYETGYKSGGRIRPQTMEWTVRILEEAENKGIRVLGMMHHGLVEHMQYQSTFFSDYLIEDWQEISDMLADAGLEVVFTGHFHSNDITSRVSLAGNIVYDIETASLAQYPFVYRIMKLSDSDLSIETRFITSVPGNLDLEEVYREKLDLLTRNAAADRLKKYGLLFPEEMLNVLTDLIAKLNMAHVKGDEMPDPEIMAAIQKFAAFLGNEVKTEDYSFDFPPADNKLIIEFSNSKYKIIED